MIIPSESEVMAALKLILPTANLEELTLRSIRQQLSDENQWDLEPHRGLIKDIVSRFLIVASTQPTTDSINEENSIDETIKNEPETEFIRNSTIKKTNSNGSGFQQTVVMTPDLSIFLGVDRIKRTEVTKRIWAYIREHNLQNPAKRTEILLDEALQKVFKRKKVHMMMMTKLLSNMMRRPEDVIGADLSDSEEEETKVQKSTKKATTKSKTIQKRPVKKKVTEDIESDVEESEESEDDDDDDDDDDEEDFIPKKKKSKTAKSSKVYRVDSLGTSYTIRKKLDKTTGKYVESTNKKTCVIAPSLADALGSTHFETRPQIVKRLWEYIRERNLQDPNDRRSIIFDDKLSKAFHAKKATMFSINKLLSPLIKMVENEP